MFGAIHEDNEYTKRYNYELSKKYADENVISYIRREILRWLGHTTRMHGKTIGKRRPGRPKLRLINAVDRTKNRN